MEKPFVWKDDLVLRDTGDFFIFGPL